MRRKLYLQALIAVAILAILVTSLPAQTRRPSPLFTGTSLPTPPEQARVAVQTVDVRERLLPGERRIISKNWRS